jgi:hypothetical protein
MLSPHTSQSPKTSSCPEVGDTAHATTRREATPRRRARRVSLRLAFSVRHGVSWDVRSRLTNELRRSRQPTQNRKYAERPIANPKRGGCCLQRFVRPESTERRPGIRMPVRSMWLVSPLGRMLNLWRRRRERARLRGGLLLLPIPGRQCSVRHLRWGRMLRDLHVVPGMV